MAEAAQAEELAVGTGGGRTGRAGGGGLEEAGRRWRAQVVGGGGGPEVAGGAGGPGGGGPGGGSRWWQRGSGAERRTRKMDDGVRTVARQRAGRSSRRARVGPRRWVGGGGGSYAVAEEEVRSMIGLFAQLGKSRKDPETAMDTATFQSRLDGALPVRAQYTLQQALAGLAAQAPTEKPDKPMLLKLAEHVAIRFALDSYERGELRVNAVKQLLDRMNSEIEALRKILGAQEEMMASAGIPGAVVHGIAGPGILAAGAGREQEGSADVG